MGWFGSKIDDVKRMETEKDVDGLIELFWDPNGNHSEDEFISIVDALGTIGDERAVEPLIGVLEVEGWPENWYVRSWAAGALGKIGDTRAVEPLIKALGDNKDKDVFEAAAGALAQIGDARAVEPFIKALKQGRSDIVPFLEKMPPAAVGAEYERLELYDNAEEWYTSHGMLEEAAAARRKKAEMGAAKTEIHGDYVDDRDTIIKDSVISKSSIGAGGKSKAEQIKEIKELLDAGAISEEDYQKMKREIVG